MNSINKGAKSLSVGVGNKDKPTKAAETAYDFLPVEAHDLNAEAAVLSAALNDPGVIPVIIEKCRSTNFYSTQHKIIFNAISDMFGEGVGIDPVTLVDRLTRDGVLDKAGGIPRINELSSFVLTAAHIEHHIKIVTENAQLRALIDACTCIARICTSSGLSTPEIIDRAEQMIFAVASLPRVGGLVEATELTGPVLDMVDKILSGQLRHIGVPTGYVGLDRITGGFRPGQLCILAARPSVGKSALALNIANNMAITSNRKVALFSMEMSAEELMHRLLTSVSAVNIDGIIRGRSGKGEDKVLALVSTAADKIAGKRLYIDDSATNTVLEISAKSRRLISAIGGLDLIIIDYMQLMNPNKARDTRQLEMSDISRALKILAKDLNVPVLALSQLNRLPEQRDDKRPRLSDLRDSGAIEQDADLVMFMYRDDLYYHETTEMPLTSELIVSKNRCGHTGTINLCFSGNSIKFISTTEPKSI